MSRHAGRKGRDMPMIAHLLIRAGAFLAGALLFLLVPLWIESLFGSSDSAAGVYLQRRNSASRGDGLFIALMSSTVHWAANILVRHPKAVPSSCRVIYGSLVAGVLTLPLFIAVLRLGDWFTGDGFTPTWLEAVQFVAPALLATWGTNWIVQNMPAPPAR